MTPLRITTASISKTLTLLACLVAGTVAHGQTASFVPDQRWLPMQIVQTRQSGERAFQSSTGHVVISSTPISDAVPPWFVPTAEPRQPSWPPVAIRTSIEPDFSIDQRPASVPTNPYVSQNLAALPEASWSLQHMPDGLLYSSYLAGPRESRIGGAWLSNSDGPDVWDVALGGRVGILRWGTGNPQWPEGWQLDIEGAAFPRLNLDYDADVDATDFRFGIPLTWRQGPWQAKFAYYHLSSHAGDEFIERNPGFERDNFSRNAVVLGLGYFVNPDLRLYAEADYGVSTDGGADPWLFQFGFDYAPSQPTGLRGAPFVAANGFLREEVDFGGTFTLMAGWAWRADRSGHLCRVGLQYSDGHTSQLEFHRESEQLIGFGIWYDF